MVCSLDLLEVKYFAQFDGDRAVVGIARHDVAHVFPPALAFRSRSHRRPPDFICDLHVAEQLPRLRVEKDRVIGGTMGLQDRLKIGPNRPVPTFIFGFKTGIDGHDKGFANHGRGKGKGSQDNRTIPKPP